MYRLQGEWDNQQRQRDEAEKRRQHEAELERAKLRYIEKARWDHFVRLSDAWHEGRKHREFLDAAKVAIQALDDETLRLAHEQLQVIEALLQKSDAIRNPELIIPVIRDPPRY